MRISKRGIDFNKEIFMGEIGGLLGAPLFGFISSLIMHESNFISLFTVLGSIVGASTSWMLTRIHNEKKRNIFSIKKFTKDLAFYSPAAFFIAVFIAYPTIFFITRFILKFNAHPIFASLTGEFSGFMLFLIMINIYRLGINRFFNRTL